jgi:hypothetical protein
MRLKVCRILQPHSKTILAVSMRLFSHFCLKVPMDIVCSKPHLGVPSDPNGRYGKCCAHRAVEPPQSRALL